MLTTLNTAAPALAYVTDHEIDVEVLEDFPGVLVLSVYVPHAGLNAEVLYGEPSNGHVNERGAYVEFAPADSAPPRWKPISLVGVRGDEWDVVLEVSGSFNTITFTRQ